MGKKCDCKIGTIKDNGDVCQSCQVELELSGGTYCLAYRERMIVDEVESMWEELERIEADTLADEPLFVDDGNAAQSSAVVERISQPARKHTRGQRRRNRGA